VLLRQAATAHRQHRSQLHQLSKISTEDRRICTYCWWNWQYSSAVGLVWAHKMHAAEHCFNAHTSCTANPEALKGALVVIGEVFILSGMRGHPQSFVLHQHESKEPCFRNSLHVASKHIQQ
jgi:hypothetical protein